MPVVKSLLLIDPTWKLTCRLNQHFQLQQLPLQVSVMFAFMLLIDFTTQQNILSSVGTNKFDFILHFLHNYWSNNLNVYLCYRGIDRNLSVNCVEMNI